MRVQDMAGLAKAVASEAWERRGRIGAWALWRALALCAAFAFGIASSAVYEMADFSSLSKIRREPLAHARVGDCDAVMAKIPKSLKEEGSRQPARFGCRKEGAGEFVERWVSGGGRAQSVARMALAEPALGAYAWLDDLAWERTPARWSWAGFWELAGVKAPSEASRGWEAGSAAMGASGVWGWLMSSALGWLKAAGLLILGVVEGLPLILAMMAMMGLAFFAWAQARSMGASQRAARVAAAGGSLGVAALMAAGLMAWSALALARGAQAGEAARWGRAPDCEAMVERAREDGRGWKERRFVCREQGGELGVAMMGPAAWDGAMAERKAKEALGSSVEFEQMGSGRASWRAFAELSGWAPLTGASLDWAEGAPAIWQGHAGWGEVSETLWRADVGMAMVFFGGVLCALAVKAAGILSAGLRGAGARMMAECERLAGDEEFSRRAREREARWSKRWRSWGEG